MFPTFDYTTLLAGVQRGLVYLLAGILCLAVAKTILTAVLAPSCGTTGASTISSLLVFVVVGMFTAYILTHNTGCFAAPLAVITQPFQMVNDMLSSLTATLSAF